MRLSRRGLLAGGAAVGTVAATGVLVEYDVLPGRTRAHDLLGLTGADGTVPDTEPGPVEQGVLDSTRIATPPGWVIAHPPGVAPGRRLPVVVVLHYAGSNAQGVFDTLGLARFLAASGAPVALAAVDGGARSYWQAHDDEDPGAMVLEEFLPLLDGRGLDVSAPGWLGWSMGGYGALRLAALRQEAGEGNGPVLAVSPALWSSYSEAPAGVFADQAQYDEARALLAVEPRPVTRVDIGTGDPFYRTVLGFVAGQEIETHFEAGDHTPGYWTRELPGQLDWLAQGLAGPG